MAVDASKIRFANHLRRVRKQEALRRVIPQRQRRTLNDRFSTITARCHDRWPSARPADLAHDGVMAVTVVLAQGFAGEGVEVVAGGRTYPFGAARTSPLTGMAGEVVVDAVLVGQVAATGPGQIQVSARLTPAPAADPPTPTRGLVQASQPIRADR